MVSFLLALLLITIAIGLIYISWILLTICHFIGIMGLFAGIVLLKFVILGVLSSV